MVKSAVSSTPDEKPVNDQKQVRVDYASKKTIEVDHFFQQTHFFNTVAELKKLHQDGLPEIAFVGRSNSGKSSTINALTLQNRLAYVSRMPGRTQHLNFFHIIQQKEVVGYLVDLPGYGFSQASKTVEQTWANFLARYLQIRDSLKGLVMIMDIRHPLTALDEYLLQWFLPTGKPIHIVLNKCDKIGHQAQMQTLAKLKNNLKILYHKDVLKQISVQLFSADRKTHLNDLIGHLKTWIVQESLETAKTTEPLQSSDSANVATSN
jgi:GTP-binding protein